MTDEQEDWTEAFFSEMRASFTIGEWAPFVSATPYPKIAAIGGARLSDIATQPAVRDFEKMRDVALKWVRRHEDHLASKLEE